MTAAVATTCPRCQSPFIERDAFAYTCVFGHSILRAAVEPAVAPAPAPPVLHPVAVSPLPPPRPRSRAGSDIPPAAVSWLWPGRIPYGKVTLLDGDPGLGKSLLTLDLAARVSTGRALPHCTTAPAPPAAVILL